MKFDLPAYDALYWSTRVIGWRDFLPTLTPHEVDAVAARSTNKNVCPFTIITDSREQLPFTFDDIPADADEGGGVSRDTTLIVKTMRAALPVGDYSIFGLPQIVIERKSKEDLYGSMSSTKARKNFEGRLQRMCSDYAWSAVVIEAEWSSILGDPPKFTEFPPKAVFRTISAWQQRYPLVHWITAPGRELAEIMTFRMLDRFWADNHGQAEMMAEGDKLRGVMKTASGIEV